MKVKSQWLEYGEAILIAFILAMFIRAFIVQAYRIPSGSMLDTLLIGDRLLVNKFSYGVKLPFTDITLFDVGDPQVGDIIVFAYPMDPSVDYIKRVVGVPGDVLEMHNKVLFRNGKKVDEPYTRFTDTIHNRMPIRDDFPPITVPENKYFAMGDNRDDSRDSRYWQFVDRSAIHGKAWRIYWSWGDKPGDAGSSGYPDTGPRWSRIGKLVK